MQCALEISSNSGLKREHMESCSSTTKHVSALPQCLWRPNLKSYALLIMWSAKILKPLYVSPQPQCLWSPKFAGWLLTLRDS